MRGRDTLEYSKQTQGWLETGAPITKGKAERAGAGQSGESSGETLSMYINNWSV